MVFNNLVVWTSWFLAKDTKIKSMFSLSWGLLYWDTGSWAWLFLMRSTCMVYIAYCSMEHNRDLERVTHGFIFKGLCVSCALSGSHMCNQVCFLYWGILRAFLMATSGFCLVHCFVLTYSVPHTHIWIQLL